MSTTAGFAGALLQTTLALVAVSALAVLVLRLARRRQDAPGRALRVVSRLSLEPRRSLYLVDAAGRYLLVGVGDGPMTVLAELGPGEVAALAAEGARADAATPIADAAAGWKQLARRLVGGRSS